MRGVALKSDVAAARLKPQSLEALASPTLEATAEAPPATFATWLQIVIAEVNWISLQLLLLDIPLRAADAIRQNAEGPRTRKRKNLDHLNGDRVRVEHHADTGVACASGHGKRLAMLVRTVVARPMQQRVRGRNLSLRPPAVCFGFDEG